MRSLSAPYRDLGSVIQLCSAMPPSMASTLPALLALCLGESSASAPAAISSGVPGQYNPVDLGHRGSAATPQFAAPVIGAVSPANSLMQFLRWAALAACYAPCGGSAPV